MAIRFYRRIGLVKGLTLNLGKTGASISAGVRGAHMNFGGAGGTRATLGIPGTGLFWSYNFTAESRRKERYEAKQRRDAAYAAEKNQRARERERKKQERERAIEQAIQAKKIHLETLQTESDEYNNYISLLSTFHQFIVDNEQAQSEFLNRLNTSYYKMNEFQYENFSLEQLNSSGVTFKDDENSLKQLEIFYKILLRTNCEYKSNKIKINGLKNKMFSFLHTGAIKDCEQSNSRIDFQYLSRYNALKHFIEEQEARYREFITQEIENEQSHIKCEPIRIDILQQAQNNNIDAISILCEALFPLSIDVAAPSWIDSTSLHDYNVGYHVETFEEAWLLIELPDFSIIPEYSVILSPAGQSITYPEISQRNRIALYEKFAASFSLLHSQLLYLTFPRFKKIWIESYTKVNNPATGMPMRKELIHGYVFTEDFKMFNFKQITDPVEAVKAMKLEFFPFASKNFVAPQWEESDERIIWASYEDDVPDGLLPF